jgi:hypothetical protein
MSGVTSGIKYIKINTTDSNGKDYTARLANANSIKINYAGSSSVQYDILSIQQKTGTSFQGSTNYFLLGVIPTSFTSSNPGRFGFSLKASASYNMSNLSTTPVWNGAYNTFFFNIGSGSSINNSQGDALMFYETGSSGDMFNPIPAKYTFRAIPNEILNIQFTCSIKNSNGGVNAPFTASLYLISPNAFPVSFPIAQAVIPFSNTLSFSGSINTLSSGLDAVIKSGSYFYIQGINSISVNPLTASFAELNIVASPYSVPSSSITNIYPENINFLNSDENALYNNATIPKYSNIYQDIDYSTGLVPTNFDLLISGNADAAPIQDSNYTATGWSNSRYNGSRVSSLDFNI